jgi:alcohol dehydrogenase
VNAVVYRAFNERPAVETVPDPTPPGGGVVLQVEATGICRSDWHGWRGHDPDITVPHVPGHELVGTVVDTGRGVEEWTAGDRVTLPFVCGCGRCAQCAAGHPQVCDHQFQPGFTHWGSFAEFVAIHYADANLVRLPESIDAVTAASLGCRFATSFRAVVDQGDVRAGQWVAVHGCGGVGLSAIMIARALGAQVVGIDINERALDHARAVGASATIHAGTCADVVSAVRDVTGGGAHVSLDALGHPDTAFHSVACLRKRGTHVQVGLLLNDHRHAPVPMDQVIANELTLCGTHGMAAHRYPAMLAMIEAGTLHPDQLVRETIPLTDAPEALARLDERDGGGVIVIDAFNSV